MLQIIPLGRPEILFPFLPIPVPDHPQLLQLFLLFLRQRLIQSLILHFRSQITDPSPKPEPILRHISSLNIQIPMLLIISLQFSQRLIPALVLTVPDHPDLIQLPDLLLTQISGHRTCTDPALRLNPASKRKPCLRQITLRNFQIPLFPVILPCGNIIGFPGRT